MREIIKTREKKEPNEPFVNKVVLEKVVDEILAEKKKEEDLSEAFSRRVFVNYNMEMGFVFSKAQDMEAEQFYDEIVRQLAQILKTRGWDYSFKVKSRTEPERPDRDDWYTRWDEKNEERNLRQNQPRL